MDERNPWNDLLYNAGVRISVIGVLAILALFLSAETIRVAQDLGRPSNPATDTITVEGSGRAVLPPDVARLSFSVFHTAVAVSDAQTATTKQANDALSYLAKQGIAQKDVKTLSYNISPQYSYPQPCPVVLGSARPCDTTPKITGYQVSQTIEVTVRDLAKVGTLLGGLGSLEIQNVNGPDFALDDPSAGTDAARSDAIANAKTQAARLARELGVSLGKIVSFSETPNAVPQPVFGFSSAGTANKAVVPTVPAGENTYTANVSITYEIR